MSNAIRTGRSNVASVSQTSLNLLRDCERCFYCDAKLGIKRPSSPMSTLLTKLDRIVCSTWNEHAAAGKLPPLLTAQLAGTPVIPQIKSWFDHATGLSVSGRLDACLRVEAELFVPVDHKGRGYPPNGTHEAYQLQLDVYDLLLGRNGYPTAGYGLLVYYIIQQGDPDIGLPLDIEIQKVETDARRALAWMEKAASVLALGDPPEPSPGCAFCNWAAAIGPAA